MKISLHTLVVEQAAHTLGCISAVLDKALAHAEAKKFDPNVLLGSRLAPDMFPLARQVQIATDAVKLGAARLARQEAPRFEDTEQTIPELKARIARTIDFLKSLPANAFEGGEDVDIKIALRDRTVEMKGLPYLSGWVLPNFFFHCSMVYAILRHNGVDLGKRDFLG